MTNDGVHHVMRPGGKRFSPEPVPARLCRTKKLVAICDLRRSRSGTSQVTWLLAFCSGITLAPAPERLRRKAFPPGRITPTKSFRVEFEGEEVEGAWAGSGGVPFRASGEWKRWHPACGFCFSIASGMNTTRVRSPRTRKGSPRRPAKETSSPEELHGGDFYE